MDSITARADGLSGISIMSPYSQNVKISATENIHKLGEARRTAISQNVDMDQAKNGGPNHLKAWREKREITQEALAELVGTTASVISYLEQGERGLSAKWLRRLAPALEITPGLLLDHDPADLSDDIIEMWISASINQKRQIAEITKTILRTGTEG